MTAPTHILAAGKLSAGYDSGPVLDEVDFHVDDGEVVVFLGANGAGKTTTLRAICQMIPTSGTLTLAGQSLTGLATSEVIRRGIAHVPQGRGTFSELSVDDNLRVGAYFRDDDGVRAEMERWYDVFPRLSQRRRQPAGSLSGGEQQMLALARAMMSRPRVVLMDEPSLGLAPNITESLFELLGELNRKERLTLLLVEQNAELALAIAHRAYVLEAGRVVLSGSAADLRGNDDVRRAYLRH